MNKTTTLEEVVNSYTTEFSAETLNRHFSYHSAPQTKCLIMLALAKSVKDINERRRIPEISGIMAQYKKYGDSTYKVLANMTNEPFPLVHSAIAGSEHSKNSVQSSLVDPQTGTITAERYARIGLTKLGDLAIRHYRNVDIAKTNCIKSIVPMNLFTSSLSITLGYKTENLSLNPREVFSLMHEMTRLGTKELPMETVRDIFKGPDVGEGYHIFMSNNSLISYYELGRGNVTIYPNISFEDKMIVFDNPPYKSTTDKLELYIGNKFLKSLEENVSAYKTFGLSATSATNGSSLYLKNIYFTDTIEGNPRYQKDVMCEIWNDKMIRRSYLITNSTLVDEEVDGYVEDNDKDKKRIVEIKPIKDTLWEHIEYEIQAKRKQIEENIKRKSDDLRVAILLDKVTRKGVNTEIKNLLLMDNRKQLLLDIYGKDSTDTRKTEQLGELGETGFLSEIEVDLIYSENRSLKLGNKSLNLLAILSLRKKYENLWVEIQEEISEEMAKLNDPNNSWIRQSILNDLVEMIQDPSTARKSFIYFVDDSEHEEAIKNGLNDATEFQKIPFTFSGLSDWSVEENLPCTIFWNKRVYFKSYGKNINSTLNKFPKRNIPTNSIDVLNKDMLKMIYLDNDNVIHETNFYVYDLNITHNKLKEIKLILPMDNPNEESIDKRIIILSHKNQEKKVLQKMIILNKGEYCPDILSLGLEDVNLISYIRIPKETKYLDILLANKNSKKNRKVVRVTKASFLHTINYLEGQPLYSALFGKSAKIIDIIAVNNEEDSLKILNMPISDEIDRDVPLTNLYETEDFVGDKLIKYTHFNDKIKVYMWNMFVSYYKELGLVEEQHNYYNKKSPLEEICWIHQYNNMSNEIIEDYHKILANESDLYFVNIIIGFSSLNYQLFKITDLSNFKYVDIRYGLPKEIPTEEDSRKLCNDYYNKICNGTIHRDDISDFSNSIIEV